MALAFVLSHVDPVGRHVARALAEVLVLAFERPHPSTKRAATVVAPSRYGQTEETRTR